MLPDRWKKQPIGEVCRSIVPGRNKPKVFNGDIPWITTPEITGKYIPSKDQVNYVSIEELKRSGGKIIPENSVVISCVGNLGLVAIATREVVINQQLHAFVCPPSLDHEYLAHFLSSQKQYMESIASQTTIPYLNKSNCESIPIILPPLPEQQKIAKILSTWDEAIEKIEKLIKGKKKMKMNLSNLLLFGKLRFREFRTSASSSNKERQLPNDWSEIPLGDCIVLLKSGLSRKLSNTDVGLPVIRANNVGDKYTKFDDVKYWYNDDPQGANTKQYILDEGDLLINFINSDAGMGKVCLYKNYLNRDCIYTTNILRMKTNKKLSSEYFFHLSKTATYVDKIKKITKPAVNQSSFTTVDFKALRFLLPSFPEQQKISKLLSQYDQEISSLEEIRGKLVIQKQGLMQVLLTGKKRVKTS
ncbi:MAG: restriction endonuclease subunit S [Oligoflexia bacterium]|nr:restriction endonuclease subunit S [Oligoflexia bacterium]MBF0365336.1 restriction endonuclease subunit S [Oligoflexia bacterium]